MLHQRKKLNLGMAAVILSLAWPTMLEQLMHTAVQYIDTAMVGTLGTQATAAVGATSTVSWVVGSSTSALGIGFLSFIARAYGAGNREEAKRASAQASLVVLAVGTLFTGLCLGCAGCDQKNTAGRQTTLPSPRFSIANAIVHLFLICIVRTVIFFPVRIFA